MNQSCPTHPRHCSREGRTLIKIISTEVISSASKRQQLVHQPSAVWSIAPPPLVPFCSSVCSCSFLFVLILLLHLLPLVLHAHCLFSSSSYAQSFQLFLLFSVLLFITLSLVSLDPFAFQGTHNYCAPFVGRSSGGTFCGALTRVICLSSSGDSCGWRGSEWRWLKWWLLL